MVTKTFPTLKILTVKTVGTYVDKRKTITVEEVTDESPVEKVVKKATTKRRPAPAAEPSAKRKRTTVQRADPTETNLEIVPVVQDPESISVIPTASPSVRRCQAPKTKLVLQESDEEEIVEQGTDKKRTVVEKPIVEETVEEIVAKVIAETIEIEMEEMEIVETAVEEIAAQQIVVVATVETDLEEPVVMKTAGMEAVETESRIGVSSITNDDVVLSYKMLSNEEGPLVEKDKETEKKATDKGKIVAEAIDFEDTEPLRKVLEITETSMSDEESMSIDDILRLPEDMMLPSVTAEEPTKIKVEEFLLGKDEEKRVLEAEKKALAIKLANTRARADGEIRSICSDVERLKGEAEDAWNLGKERFLKSLEFETLCSDKASVFFECEFKGFLAQFRANGYFEEEDPASFLDVVQSLENMPEER
ncbi:myosin-17-like [Dorcoceras hygrometricum]|uniref:Myosin-17-like n=1 Tax=Dorcoceras hygrometricum TaxID=472368 RepID=A0A2Z7B166_9LAMI|nr:myosin-17-like [Dorcoceras hygrometricum]